jgi:hypothetical protein
VLGFKLKELKKENAGGATWAANAKSCKAQRRKLQAEYRGVTGK